MPHVGSISSERRRTLGNSRTAISDITPINKAKFVVHVAQAHRANGLYWDELDVLHKQAVDYHVEDELHKEGIDEAK